jgi:hypothetical protein
MSDPCSLVTQVACSLALLSAFVTVILSARLLGFVLRETRRIQQRVDMEKRISEAARPSEIEYSAARPPSHRP